MGIRWRGTLQARTRQASREYPRILPKGGRHSIRFEARGQSNGFQAVSQRIEVKGGSTYTFTVGVRSDPKAPFRGTDAYGQWVVQWFNANGEEIGRVWSPGWTRTLTRLRWESFAVRKVKAPTGAVYALVGIHLYEKSGASGAFFVDNVTVSSS